VEFVAVGDRYLRKLSMRLSLATRQSLRIRGGGITSTRLSKEQLNVENVNYAIKVNYLKNPIDLLPEQIELPGNIAVFKLPLTEKIELISDFVPIIRVK